MTNGPPATAGYSGMCCKYELDKALVKRPPLRSLHECAANP